MTNIIIFSIYDSKAEAYLQPFFGKTNATAIRQFQDAVQKSDTQFNQHAGDYTLFAIGEFDENSGSIAPLNANVKLANGIEFVDSKIQGE